jgi:hypothetical protein
MFNKVKLSLPKNQKGLSILIKKNILLKKVNQISSQKL